MMPDHLIVKRRNKLQKGDDPRGYLSRGRLKGLKSGSQ